MVSVREVERLFILSSVQSCKLVLQAGAVRLLYKEKINGLDGESALEIASSALYCAPKTIDAWDKELVTNGSLRASKRGQHERRFVLDLDEGILAEVKQHLRENCGRRTGLANMTAEDFRTSINDIIIMPS